jgi:hypothetical protein
MNNSPEEAEPNTEFVTGFMKKNSNLQTHNAYSLHYGSYHCTIHKDLEAGNSAPVMETGFHNPNVVSDHCYHSETSRVKLWLRVQCQATGLVFID